MTVPIDFGFVYSKSPEKNAREGSDSRHEKKIN